MHWQRAADAAAAILREKPGSPKGAGRPPQGMGYILDGHTTQPIDASTKRRTRKGQLRSKSDPEMGPGGEAGGGREGSRSLPELTSPQHRKRNPTGPQIVSTNNRRTADVKK